MRVCYHSFKKAAVIKAVLGGYHIFGGISQNISQSQCIRNISKYAYQRILSIGHLITRQFL